MVIILYIIISIYLFIVNFDAEKNTRQLILMLSDFIRENMFTIPYKMF